MDISLRSIITAGISTATATTLVFAPSVQPPPPPERTVRLAAAVQPLAQQQELLSVLRTSPARLLGPAVTPGAITPPTAALAIPVAPNLANTIDAVYNAVEPWVRYGFQVATDVLAWVPVVGWLSGQIMVFYTFGESIVQSAVFNFTDWLRGEGGAISNIVDFGVDVALSFVWLGIDEVAYFIPLPPIPLPPRPPLNQFAVAAAATPDVGVANAASDFVDEVYISVRDGIGFGVDVLQGAHADSVVFGLIDPVLNAPLNINSYIDGAVNVGTAVVDSLINTGIAEVDYFLGIPLSAEANGPSDSAAVPPLDKATFAPVDNAVDALRTHVDAAAPEADAASVVTGSDATDDSADVAEAVVKAPRKVLRGVVRGQGELAGAVSKATNDVTEAAASGDGEKTGEAVAKAPRTVTKGVRDCARKAADGIKKAGDDVRKAVNDARADKADNDGADKADAE